MQYAPTSLCKLATCNSKLITNYSLLITVF